ncbi:MAG: hypothetical protein HY721_02705 [Planctomycetes bacterium]|nr:hypothetical protein [Planctomycetota bacterium]
MASFLLLPVACRNGRDKTVRITEEAPINDPAHHQGQDCVACHTTWNMVQLHDASSPAYNSDCIKCHGDMTDETTLDDDVEGIHPRMVPYVLQAAGQTETNNTVCAYCHESVDLLGGSAANLRKQVAASDCQGCHTLAGPGRELYE